MDHKGAAVCTYCVEQTSGGENLKFKLRGSLVFSTFKTFQITQMIVYTWHEHFMKARRTGCHHYQYVIVYA